MTALFNYVIAFTAAKDSVPSVCDVIIYDVARGEK